VKNLLVERNDTPFTIIILPRGAGKVFRFQLSAQGYRRLKILSLLSLILFLIATGYSIYNIVQIPARYRLHALLLTQSLHLSELANRLEYLESTLARMEGFERRVRLALGVPEEPPYPQPGGVGGPEGSGTLDLKGVPDPQLRSFLMELYQRSGVLEERAKGEEFRLQDLYFSAQDEAERILRTPSILPARGWMSSDFGVRENPFTGSEGMHEGVDIAGRFGSPVVATADGYVAFAGENQGYGKMVVLQHGFGISTIYGHLSDILVREGMQVRRGEMIGRMGSTGRSTGPHVHYEVRVFGVPTDPKKYFLFEDYFIP